jgi:Arm DNA-binding domain
LPPCKPGEKPIRLFDGGGLYLEVSPTGGKWWRLKYRFDGKEKRLSLGVYPDVSLKDARDRRDASRKLLADGIDPSELPGHRPRLVGGFCVSRVCFCQTVARYDARHESCASRG